MTSPDHPNPPTLHRHRPSCENPLTQRGLRRRKPGSRAEKAVVVRGSAHTTTPRATPINPLPVAAGHHVRNHSHTGTPVTRTRRFAPHSTPPCEDLLIQRTSRKQTSGHRQPSTYPSPARPTALSPVARHPAKANATIAPFNASDPYPRRRAHVPNQRVQVGAVGIRVNGGGRVGERGDDCGQPCGFVGILPR